LDINTFAKAVRGHWGVENQLHWSLDVPSTKTKSRARSKMPPKTSPHCAVSRSISSKKTPSKKSLCDKKESFAALDTDFLGQLLGI
jgi:predicted transposase YbfD/YdcC